MRNNLSKLGAVEQIKRPDYLPKRVRYLYVFADSDFYLPWGFPKGTVVRVRSQGRVRVGDKVYVKSEGIFFLARLFPEFCSVVRVEYPGGSYRAYQEDVEVFGPVVSCHFPKDWGRKGGDDD